MISNAKKTCLKLQSFRLLNLINTANHPNTLTTWQEKNHNHVLIEFDFKSDTDSDGQKYVDVVSKGHKQEKRNEDVDRSLSNHSLKWRPFSTVRVNRATSTSQRNLLTSQTSLKSTPLTSEKQNQTSRLSLEPPLPVFKSTTGQMSHLSMNSAPPVFRSVPDKRFKLSRMSINSAPPTKR